jgi:hypothetical protein
MPQVDYIVAKSGKDNKTFVVLLNNQPDAVNAKFTWGNKGKAFKRLQ